jgi:hypothetical protein
MNTPSAIDPGGFLHVRVVLGMVIGLGLTRLLSGFAHGVQHPRRKPAYWVHRLWVVSAFVTLLHFWWWQFSLSAIPQWHFLLYAFLVCYAALLYLLCTMLMPDDMSDYADYRDYFMQRRAWIFGLFALSLAADIADTALKGRAHVEQEGIEYFVRIAVLAAASLGATITRNARFHAAFAVANLAWQLSWILRRYDTL